MIHKRYLVALAAIPLFGAVHAADTTLGSLPVLGQVCKPYNATVPGAGGGQAQINGQVCTTPLDASAPLTGTGTVLFTAYTPSAQQTFSADGQFNLEYNLYTPQSPQTYSMLYDGGPVSYTINGTPYEVYLQQLRFEFAYVPGAAPQLTGVSGGVTVNGHYIPASGMLYDYVKVM